MKPYILLLIFFLSSTLYVHAQSDVQKPPKKKFWERAGHGMTKGVIDAVRENVEVKTTDIDTIGYHAAHGMVGGVVDGLKNANVQVNIDSAINHIGMLATENLERMLDSLLLMNDTAVGFHLLQWAGKLREEMLGKGLQLNVQRLIATMLSDNTELRTRKLVRGVIDEGLSETTHRQMEALIITAGNAANQQIGKTMDTIFQHFDDYTKRKEETLHEKIHPYFVGIIATGIGLLLAIIVLVYIYLRNKKYERLTNVLTYEIHKSKSDVFEDLAERIRDHAQRNRIENFLRDELERRGMLGDKTRVSVNKSDKKST